MSNLTQNLLAFAKGFTGVIPVWSPSGDEVGYITDYANDWFYLNPPYASIAGADLITKNWLFQDVAIKVVNAAPAPTEKGKVKINFTRPANAIKLPSIGGVEIGVTPTMLTMGAALLAFVVLTRSKSSNG